MVERGREEVCQGGGAFGEGLGAAGTTPVLLHMDEETTPAQVLDYLHVRTCQQILVCTYHVQRSINTGNTQYKTVHVGVYRRLISMAFVMNENDRRVHKLPLLLRQISLVCYVHR